MAATAKAPAKATAKGRSRAKVAGKRSIRAGYDARQDAGSMAEAARGEMGKVLGCLVACVEDESASWADRIRACGMLMERAHGRPWSAVEGGRGTVGEGVAEIVAALGGGDE